MTLGGEELRAAYYCAADVLRSRQLAGQPIPAWLHLHYSRLDAAVKADVSESGRENDSGSAVLEAQQQLISAREAADVLKLSKRQVQRLAADLDGHIVDGRWLFHRAAVIEYQQGRDA